jgi:hypothetical protein
MRYKIYIEPNQGYGSDQTKPITVADLRDMLAELELDDEICTYDYQNRYGAKYGGLTLEIEKVNESEE